MNRGFSLIEMLVYVAIIAIMTISIVGILLALSDVYSRLAVVSRANSSGAAALDRIVREIRGAESIDIVTSQFATSSGVLVLNTRTSGGSPTTVSFFVDENGILQVEEGGAAAGRLTVAGVSVPELRFTRISGARSEMVVAELTLYVAYRRATTTKTFESGAVLRGSY